jgi:hypothetical protein
MEKEPKKFPEGYFEKKAEEYNISGKGLDNDSRVDAVAYLEGRKDQAMKPKEEELEKTEEEIRFIEFAEEILQKEIDGLGIDKKIEISPEQIHILPVRAYFEATGGKGGRSAGFRAVDQEILVNKDMHKTRLNFFTSIFHEMIHSASFLAFHKKTDGGELGTSKVGYVSARGAEGQTSLVFNALNEMVVDKLLPEMLKKNKEEFCKKFNISEEEGSRPVDYYPTEILNIIIDKIAKEKNEDGEKVWSRFKRGLFTGEMMHLRDVEKVFGEKSLRLLDSMDFTNGMEEEFTEDLLKIFQIENDKKREKKIEKLLTKEVRTKPKIKSEMISRK